MKARLEAFLIVLPLILAFTATALAESGEETFRKRCAGCHGANGAGETTIGRNLKARDLRSAEVQKQANEELASIISKGKSGRMPPFENKLTKEQIEELVKFIRSLKK